MLVLIKKPFKSLTLLCTGLLLITPVDVLAVTVSTQMELDAAIVNEANPITIIAGALSLSSSQTFATNTQLDIATGANLSITNSNQTIGALGGNGTITVGNTEFIVGNNNINTAFSGTINLAGEAWDVSHGLFIKNGSGALTINNSTISLGEALIFQGSMEQTSGTTTINALAVGEGSGNTGALNISGGSLNFRSSLKVGSYDGEGVVNQIGGVVTLPSLCGDPTHCSSLYIGYEGGTGIYNISGGTLALTGSVNAIGHSTGLNPESTGTLNISGGIVELLGSSSNPAQLILGLSNQSRGTINQTGGTLRLANDAKLYLSGVDGSGIYNLHGGLLEVGGDSLHASNADYQFNLGGGIIKVIGTSLLSAVDATLLSNTISTINTNGLNAVWNGTLSGSGGLAKNGSGIFMLNNASNYLGATFIDQGTFTAGAAHVLAPGSAFIIEQDATLDLNNFDNNLGSISGAGNIVLGSAYLTSGSDGTSTTFSGSIVGTGVLNKIGAGTLTLTGDNSSFIGTTTLNNGTLVINSRLGSNLNTNTTTTLRGTGVISGHTTTINGSIQPGSYSVGTLSFEEEYIQGSGSTYTMQILNSLQYNVIQVGGSATINNSAQVNVLNHGVWPVNTTLSILHAAGGVNGQYSALITGAHPFLDLSLSYGVNDVYLSIVRNFVDLADFALTANQTAVAEALDSYFFLNQQDPLYLAVVNLTDPLIMPSVLNSLSGQIHAAALGAFIEESRYLRDAVLNRLTDLHYALNATNNSTPHSDNKPGLWMEGFGAWGTMNTPSSNTAPLTRNNKGFFVGFDASLTEQWQTGIITGLGETHLNMSAFSSKGTSHNAYIGLYTTTQIAKITGYFGAAYSRHHLSTLRFVAFPGVDDSLHARYQVPSKQIFAEVGYDVQPKSHYKFKPFIQAAYVDVMHSPFEESGGISALTGLKAKDEMPYTTTGVRMTINLGDFQKLTWETRALAGWQHAYHSIYPRSSFTFTSSAPFLITGVPVAADAALIDVAIKARTPNDKVHLALGYISQLSSHIHDKGLQGSIGYKFM